MLGGDVGMPMTIFCCAPAVVGSISAAAASRATVEQSLCIIILPDYFFKVVPRGLPALMPILPDHTRKNNEGALVIRQCDDDAFRHAFDHSYRACLIAPCNASGSNHG